MTIKANLSIFLYSGQPDIRACRAIGADGDTTTGWIQISDDGSSMPDAGLTLHFDHSEQIVRFARSLMVAVAPIAIERMSDPRLPADPTSTAQSVGAGAKK